MSLKPYLGQFKEKLGIEAYKGTLNLRVEYPDFLSFVNTQKRILIPGFTAKDRSFGNLVAYKVKVDGISSAIIIPERTSHDNDVIEIISKAYFRKKLNLKDGQKVKIESDE
jgi:riboflavin kinase